MLQQMIYLDNKSKAIASNRKDSNFEMGMMGNNGLQPRNISIYFIEESPVVLKMGKDTSFNFLRLLCAKGVILIAMNLIQNNVTISEEEAILRCIVFYFPAVIYRSMRYITPFLWFFYHEKTKLYCEKKFKRMTQKSNIL